MKRFKLRARPLAAWCCIADIIFVLAFVVIAFMKCPPLTMYGQAQESGIVKVTSKQEYVDLFLDFMTNIFLGQ